MLDLEELTTNDLEKMRACYQQLAEQARGDSAGGPAAVGAPDVTAHKPLHPGHEVAAGAHAFRAHPLSD